jgi:hypothetical protein
MESLCLSCLLHIFFLFFSFFFNAFWVEREPRISAWEFRESKQVVLHYWFLNSTHITKCSCPGVNLQRFSLGWRTIDLHFLNTLVLLYFLKFSNWLTSSPNARQVIWFLSISLKLCVLIRHFMWAYVNSVLK